MSDSQKKKEFQKRLFDEIGKKLSPRHAPVEVVSDLLGISDDAAYRRLRGEKIMDIGECALLCAKFGVSLDGVLGLSSGSSEYSYTTLDVRGSDDYMLYMRNLASRLERLSTAPGAEIVLSATDVPFFHFMPHKELTLFKLFAWTNSVYGDTGRFEDFARSVESSELSDTYDRIAAAYGRVPSREIWTENTVDTFLKLLRYNFELELFADPRTAVSLCEQFGLLLDSVRSRARTGSKDAAGEISFRLFLSDVDMENNFILLRDDGGMGCILKLFTINSLYITDRRFCTETLHWLDQLARRSTQISVASERERHRFFATQQDKVRLMADSFGV